MQLESLSTRDLWEVEQTILEIVGRRPAANVSPVDRPYVLYHQKRLLDETKKYAGAMLGIIGPSSHAGTS